MNKKQDKKWIIILAVVIGTFSLFGLAGFFAGLNNTFGISGMCSTIGGIWCYWPHFGVMWIFMAFIPVLTLIASILFIIWLIKKLAQNKKKK